MLKLERNMLITSYNSVTENSNKTNILGILQGFPRSLCNKTSTLLVFQMVQIWRKAKRLIRVTLNHISKLCVYSVYLPLSHYRDDLRAHQVAEQRSLSSPPFVWGGFTTKHQLQGFAGAVGRLEANSQWLSVEYRFATTSVPCEMSPLIDVEKSFYYSVIKLWWFHRIVIENYWNYTVIHVNFSISPPNKFHN